jgi:hypothetical protein
MTAAVGKHGMTHGESRAIQDALEISPSKNASSSPIAVTSGKPKGGKASSAKSTGGFKETKGGS